MSDTHTETIPTPQTEQPLGNSEEARTPQGEIKNQAEPTSSTTTPSDQTTPPPNKDGDKTEAPQGAPEKYADFTAPEGYTLDKDLIEKVLPVFKEMNLSQEQAQKLVNLQAEQMLAAAKAPQQAYDDLRASWRKEVFADRTLAANDKLLPEVASNIAKGIDSLGPDLAPKFREIMDLSGVGDHPAFVAAMNLFGKAMSEGKHVSGRGPSPHGQSPSGATERPSAAKAMFPNLK